MARRIRDDSENLDIKAETVPALDEGKALSERDSLRVLDLLDNPRAPNAKLVRSAKSGQTLV